MDVGFQIEAPRGTEVTLGFITNVILWLMHCIVVSGVYSSFNNSCIQGRSFTLMLFHDLSRFFSVSCVLLLDVDLS